MNNLPGTFSLRNHFSSSPLFRPRSRSQAPAEVRYCFRRNHFSSCRPAEPVRLEATREIGFGRLDRRTIFEGTTFPRSFRLRSVAEHRQQIGSPRITAHVFEGTTFPPSFRPRLAQQEARTLGGEGTAACSSREPLSLIPLGFTDAPLAPDSLQQFFSSPSLQGGSGIPVVPKTGASVLRLLPPTS